MNVGIVNIFNNLGVSLEISILILLLISGIVFFARDFKIGLFFYFIMSGSLFMWFYNLGLNWSPFLITFFMCLIVLSFTLYFTNKTVAAGGFI